jgi:hypothetical protein
MSENEPRPRAGPLADDLRRQVADLIDRHGEAEAQRILNLNRAVFARAVAGLRVYSGTIAAVMLGLATYRGRS